MDETVFLAHIAEDGRKQTVDEHERGTAELCARFAAQFGAEEHAKLEAMRHDDGKNTHGFQKGCAAGRRLTIQRRARLNASRLMLCMKRYALRGITEDFRTLAMPKWTRRGTARSSAE